MDVFYKWLIAGGALALVIALTKIVLFIVSVGRFMQRADTGLAVIKELDEEYEQSKKELSALREFLTGLKETVEDHDELRVQLQDHLRQLEDTIQSLSRRLSGLASQQQQINNVRESIKDLYDKINTMNREIGRLEGKVND